MASLPAPISKVTYRARQVLRQVTQISSRDADVALAALLPREQLRLVMQLSPADRRHSLAIHAALVSRGESDPDLLTAALLHDIGKVDPFGRVWLVHRILKVMLSFGAPSLLDRMARANGGWLGHGIYLTLRHPAIGARLAREAGATPRTCWLIAHHDDDTIRGDESLAALREVDEEG